MRETPRGTLTPDDFRRIREVFESALERSSGERRAFVEEACAGNTVLINEVERMLGAEAARFSLLDTHPPSPSLRSDRPGVCSSCRTPLDATHRFCPACGTPTHASGSDDGRFRAGTLFANRFRIVARLGRGGMGEVYRADDLEVGQPVALKFLTGPGAGPAKAGHYGRFDERARARLRSEVRLARQISHPNVCRVYDIGESQGEIYLSMEYVDGEDLASLLTRIGRLPIDKGIEIARKLCAGLAAAHAKGVLHRDFKPANNMIDSRGEVRIMDFGLAAIASELDPREVRSGTPAYMAPEQLAGKEATKQSDLYALGLVLYELFTDRPPFDAKTAQEYLRLRESSQVTKPSTLIPELNERVERTILRCLDADPKLRPSSAAEVAASLPGADPLAEAIAAGETPSPDMVVAAGEVGSISPLTGILCLAAIAAALFAIVWLSHRSTLTSFVNIEKGPELLADRARQIARSVGATTRGANVQYRFAPNDQYLRYLEERYPTAARRDMLRSGRPAALLFSYRESSPRWDLQSVASLLGVSPDALPGTLTLALDPEGRLVKLVVASDPYQSPTSANSTDSPIEASAKPSEPDWRTVFEYAGLPVERFNRSSPRHDPPVFSDTRAAWEGTFAEHPEIPVRIEAAASAGRPVYFEIETPGPRFAVPPNLTPPPIGYFTFYLSLLAAGLALARRNLRLGRGDRRGALRLSLAVGLALFMELALTAPDFSFAVPLPLNMAGGLAAAIAASDALFYWVLYIALEPHVRRLWPDIMIGWSRLLAGRFRDPLVGKELLVGVLGGIATAAIPHLSSVVPALVGLPPTATADTWFSEISVRVLNGGRDVLSLPFLGAYFGLAWAVGAVLTLFLLTMVLRTRTRAIVFYVFVLPVLNPAFGDRTLVSTVAQGLLFALGIVMIFRFGALSFVVSAFVWPLLTSVSFDPAAAYASSWYFIFTVIIGIALYGLHTALAGQSIFDLMLFREDPDRTRA